MSRPAHSSGPFLLALVVLAMGCRRERQPSALAAPATPAVPMPAPASQLPPDVKPPPDSDGKPTPPRLPAKLGAAAPKASKSVPAAPPEASPYLVATYTLELDGRDCRQDAGAWGAMLGAAMADAKRKALDQVLAGIKASTKGADLRSGLLAAYNDATLEARVLKTQRTPDPDQGICCTATCRVELSPDPARIEKLKAR